MCKPTTAIIKKDRQPKSRPPASSSYFLFLVRSEMMSDSVVLYPSPAMGHLISMVELGKLLLSHYPSISITILMTTPPYNTGSTAPYIDRVSRTTPQILFHYLPTVSLPLDLANSPHHETLAFELLRLNNPLVHQALQAISQTSKVRALVIDGFCSTALDVANSLDIDTFVYHTSGAAALILCFYIPTIHNNTTKSFKDLNNVPLDIPGLPPIPALDMPKPILDRADKAYDCFLYCVSYFTKSKGIIVNTFDSLELRAIKTIRDGTLFPDSDVLLPSIYCIGPLIASEDRTEDGTASKAHECLAWLDSQPSRSVVFLCFGSLGLFSVEQLKEIAVGLEKSGHRFLWVVRSPPTEDQIKRFMPPPEPDLLALLPEGFLDRTKDRGLVVKTWAPQVKVLNHKSVGGFVNHCGWNSVLEALCAGVPMVAWPLYAEQRFNRVLMVKEMKLSLSMEESEAGFVSAAEVERKVIALMLSDEGKELRERTMKIRDSAIAAISDGGSSLRALDELVKAWMTR